MCCHDSFVIEPSSSALNLEVTDDDRRKIHALSWLYFEERQCIEALIQTNRLMRQFLSKKDLCGACCGVRGKGGEVPQGVGTTVPLLPPRHACTCTRCVCSWCVSLPKLCTLPFPTLGPDPVRQTPFYLPPTWDWRRLTPNHPCLHLPLSSCANAWILLI